jgi:Fe2+ or Zn2+ uptake regulation protein
LGLLKDTGMVHELHLDQEHHHYEMAGSEEHSICRGCTCCGPGPWI